MLINKHKSLEKPGSIKSVRTVSEAYIRSTESSRYIYICIIYYIQVLVTVTFT